MLIFREHPILLPVAETAFHNKINQNVYSCKKASEQPVSLALSLSEKLLDGCGAWRVHGGGFAGTIQAFVPLNKLDEYKDLMEKVFGSGSCYILSVRPVGGVEL